MFLGNEYIYSDYGKYDIHSSAVKSNLAVTMMHPNEEDDLLLLVEFDNGGPIINRSNRLVRPLVDESVTNNRFVRHTFDRTLSGKYSWDTAFNDIRKNHKDGINIYQEWYDFDKPEKTICSRMYLRSPNIEVYEWLRNDSFNGINISKRIGHDRYISITTNRRSIELLGISDIEEYFNLKIGKITYSKYDDIISLKISFDSIDELLAFMLSYSNHLEILLGGKCMVVTIEDAMYLTS